MATKVGRAVCPSPGAQDRGAGRQHILREVERSLQRLRTSYVDVLQLHCWDEHTPIEETLEVLSELVTAGKVRRIGASNFTAAHVHQAASVARERGLPMFASLQMQYSLLCRNVEWDIVNTAARYGLGLLAWSPLAGGWLSGKYHKGQDFHSNKDTRAAWATQSSMGSAWYTTQLLCLHPVSRLPYIPRCSLLLDVICCALCRRPSTLDTPLTWRVVDELGRIAVKVDSLKFFIYSAPQPRASLTAGSFTLTHVCMCGFISMINQSPL